MASSDDEGEAVPKSVSDYEFLDVNDEPISFSELPLIWGEAEGLNGGIAEIGLKGVTDNGLQKIFEQVIAWKFNISSVKPEILVLSKRKNWIKLLKPRRPFETTIRSTLITVCCLHFLRRDPETPHRVLWDKLSKEFSLYELRPCENDLVDHMNIIGEAFKRDKVLSRAKVLVRFLNEKSWKKNSFNEEAGTKTDFIDDSVAREEEERDKEKGVEDAFDAQEENFSESVCAICDEGGEILCCDGECKRSFHATVEAGFGSGCDSLGLSKKQVQEMSNFKCNNCQYKQHRCFVCGQLGSSDKSAGAEVFQCASRTCGYFYHPHCVAEALVCGDKAKSLEGQIASGEPFRCPLHICDYCKKSEPKGKSNLQEQFAVCRRCPKAYHRKCLPREIAFEDDEGMTKRAWSDLIPHKILMYCLKHNIDPELQTPIRNHVKFPDANGKKKKRTVSSGKIVKKQRANSACAIERKNISKQSQGNEKLSTMKSPVGFSSGRERRVLFPELSKKQKLTNNPKMALKKISHGKQNKSSGGESEVSSEDVLCEPISKESESGGGEACDLNDQIEAGKPVENEVNNSVMLATDSKQPQGNEKLSTLKKPVGSSSSRKRRLSIPDSSKKKLAKHSMVALEKISLGKQSKCTGGESKFSSEDGLYEPVNKDSKSLGDDASNLNNEQLEAGKPVGEEIDNSLVLDVDSRSRVLSIIEESESSITLEEVIRKRRVPSIDANSSKMQALNQGKLEGSPDHSMLVLHCANSKELPVVFQNLEEGGSLLDANTACDPGLLNQKEKGKVLFESDCLDYPPESRDLNPGSIVPMVENCLQDAGQSNDQGAKANGRHIDGCCNEVQDSVKDHRGGESRANDNVDENRISKRRRRSEEKSSAERRQRHHHSSGSRSLIDPLSRQPEMRSHSEIQREGYQCSGRRNNYSEVPCSNVRDTNYACVVPDEQFMSNQRGGPNGHGYGLYSNDLNEGFGRDMAQGRHYGHRGSTSFSYRDNYQANSAPRPSTPRMLLQSSVDSEFNNASRSVMQRYAPRLNGNPSMTNNTQPVEHFPSRRHMYHSAPRPSRPSLMGFASSPCYPQFSQNGSAGWLNE